MTDKKSFSITAESTAKLLQMIFAAGRPHFKTENAWESALCAITMLLQPRMQTCRILESLPAAPAPMQEKDFLNTIANLGYFSRAVKTPLKNIDPRLTPCLVVLPGKKPAILLEKDTHGATFCQNAKIIYLDSSKYPLTALEVRTFEIFDENRPATSKFMREGSGHSWFRALLGRFKASYIQVFFTGLILNVIALGTPLFIMLVYDRVIASSALSTLPMLAAGACLAIGFEWFLRNIRSRSLSWLACRLDNIVGNRIFSHLTGLSPELIENASVPAQIARIKTFESVRDFFSGSVFLSMIELPFILLALIAVAVIAGPLALVPLAMTLAYAGLFWAVWRKVRIAIRLAAKASSARQQFTIETFEKIKGIRGYGLIAKWEEKFRDLSGKEMMAHFHLNWLGMMAETFAHTITVLAAIMTVGFGAHLIWAGAITTGALVATMILVWRILMPFYSLCTMIPRLEQVRHSIIQVNSLMDINTESTLSRAMARLPSLRGRVEFNAVDMRYGAGGDLVLSNLSFTAHAGELVCITGENGSGKTTLLKMIKSMHLPQNGAILIDNFDIRQLNPQNLRRQIAYMPQQHNFFHATLAENLRMANPLASDDDLMKALQSADALQEINEMPGGLYETIGPYDQGNFSSSLWTRLSLARLYLHPAPIILIDEIPNSLMSTRAGENLKNFLTIMHGKRTIFMVTYREDIMRMADQIVDLRRGKTARAGTREAIINTALEKAA